ncbi:MAG: fatty acid desaturase [Chthoniobacterales bacterium]
MVASLFVYHNGDGVNGYMKILAHSNKDWIPVVAMLTHTGFVISMFFLFPHTPLWIMLILGLVYSVSISWNINGIAHNFIHNPYFKWKPANRFFSWLLSVTMGYSQQFYHLIHLKHHQGNSDYPDDGGDTVDPISIYKHGHDHEAENVWSYVFLSYFRDDPKAIFREVKKRDAFNAYWGVFEIASWVTLVIIGFFLNWQFMLFYLPFYYLGHCLSYLNGYYRHFGGNPDEPMAWGVSSYDRLYNLIWFNNGYHAEHHYKPKVHWTKMHELHKQILEEQKKAGVRVIKPPHALGFLDPDLNRDKPKTAITPGEVSKV